MAITDSLKEKLDALRLKVDNKTVDDIQLSIDEVLKQLLAQKDGKKPLFYINGKTNEVRLITPIADLLLKRFLSLLNSPINSYEERKYMMEKLNKEAEDYLEFSSYSEIMTMPIDDYAEMVKIKNEAILEYYKNSPIPNINFDELKKIP